MGPPCLVFPHFPLPLHFRVDRPNPTVRGGADLPFFSTVLEFSCTAAPRGSMAEASGIKRDSSVCPQCRHLDSERAVTNRGSRGKRAGELALTREISNCSGLRGSCSGSKNLWPRHIDISCTELNYRDVSEPYDFLELCTLCVNKGCCRTPPFTTTWSSLLSSSWTKHSVTFSSKYFKGMWYCITLCVPEAAVAVIVN